MGSEWDAAAQLRTAQITSGLDLTFSRVFVPLYRSLLEELQPSSVLEVGCGTGHLALILSHLTPQYVAVEPSTGMIAEARKTLRDTSVVLINSRIEDCDTPERFELILSHLCIQAAEDYTAFLKSAVKLLEPSGVLLAALPHPAFFNEYKKVLPLDTFRYMTEKGALINFGVTLDPSRTVQKVPYFHRPLSRYFRAFADVGLIVAYFNEVFPAKEIQALYGAAWETPRYLLVGAIKQNATSTAENAETISQRLFAIERQTQ